MSAATLERMLFTRERYDAMIAEGILTEDDRVELVNGEIIKKMSIGPNHLRCVNLLNRSLVILYGESAIVSVQNPIALNEFSEPEPDLSVLRSVEGDYGRCLPEPKDVLFLVEVADTSLKIDREQKVPLYAAGDIPAVWLVDLIGGVVTVFTEPDGNRYRKAEVFGKGDAIPVPGADAAIEAGAFLP